jgi:hypothetical protein
MGSLERVGYDDVSERELFVLELETLEDFPQDLSLPTRRFVCVLAWDASKVTTDQIAALARQLLHRGAAFVCAWGPDCRRVHDIIDSVQVGSSPSQRLDPVVMTTWHDDEPLAQAVRFSLIAWPDEGVEDDCGSTLGIAIGSMTWAREIRTAFSDPRGFVRKVDSET